MAQNTSHAVMQQRHEPDGSLDDFPTPPWATRALIEHVLYPLDMSHLTAFEPACGRGHMVRALQEYFAEVHASDVCDYGVIPKQRVSDFLAPQYLPDYMDWIITNPPFRLAEEFVEQGLKLAGRGVAVLVRSAFLESVGRYERLFRRYPPSIVAQFVERVPMHRGRLLEKGSTATAYCWLVWDKIRPMNPEFKWIPPCRARLERAPDYFWSGD